MKFLFATDTHLKGRNPSSRTDDFPRAMLLKLEELCYVAQRMNVTAILHGGDLFDVPDLANTLIGEVAGIIRKYGVPFYVVPGNHDLFGYQLKSLPQTALGVLEKAGVVKLLTRDGGPEIFEETVGNCLHKVAVQGQEYYADIDTGNPQDYEFPSWVQAEHKILIPHSMLVPREFFPGVHHTLTKDVKTSADLVMVGHYHGGYDDHTIGTTRYINPGSMGRLDATQSSINRIPQYLIIDSQPQTPLSVTPRDFKTAKAGADVLDNSHLKANAARQVQVGNFTASVANVRQLAHTDINSILLNLATQQTQPIEVIKVAKDAIIKAEQDDKGTTSTSGFIEQTHHAVINQIELEDFQSHQNTTINLTGGLNAIIGQSDSGKTAIMRAIRWVAYNEPKGSDFIRTGANETRVRVTMGDGRWVERGRSRKEAGYYAIGHTEPNGTQIMDTTFKGFGNDIPVDIQNILQMPKSNLGRGDAETINMAYQLDAPFLITEGPSMKASVIGRLTGVHLLDTAIAGINTDHLRTKKKFNEKEAELKEHESKLTAFADLDELGVKVGQLETMITSYEQWDKMSTDLMSARSNIFAAKNDIATVTTELQAYTSVKVARTRMDKIEAALGTFQQLVQIQTTIQDTTAEIEALTAEKARYVAMPMILKRLSKLDDAVRIKQDLVSTRNEIQAATNEIASIQKELGSLPDTIKLIAVADQLQVLQTTYKNLHLIRTDRNLELNDIAELNVSLAANTKHKEAAQKELDELLGSMDICPTCARPMEAHTHA